MPTFLLTWSPKKWPWETLGADHARAREHGHFDERWSCGRNKRLRKGDRVFLLRQGQEPRGIVASGVVTSDGPFLAEHFSRVGRLALYVSARFDVLLHPDREPILTRDFLDSGALAGVHWETQSSGIRVPPEAAAELEERWRAFLAQNGHSPIVLADEVPEAERYWEGAVRRAFVNAYERDPRARRACIAHFGASCQACGLDFGEIGQGFVHVHHVRPLGEVRAGYAVDPKSDLVPVCPNCHAMLHQASPPLTVEELKGRLRSARKVPDS